MCYLLKIFLSSIPSDSATMHDTAASPVTLTEVLNISRILSTANMMPIASKVSQIAAISVLI